MIINTINRSIEPKLSQTSIIIPAPAKINIGLRILNKRTDGYHDLVSIMQRVSLCDIVEISQLDIIDGVSSENKIDGSGDLPAGVEYSGPDLTVDPGDNLCVRAAVAFRKKFRNDMRVRIRLEKLIPVGAGLGGGSSDAASVLIGLAKLYGISEKAPELFNIAAKLGSDVPFFLKSNGASLIQGVGDQLSPAEGLGENLTVFIIFPDFEISTSWAYRTLDQSLTFEKLNIKLLIRDFLTYCGGIPTGEMGNDFEIPVFKKYPELDIACQKLKQAGAQFAGLSGSGSAIFGVFRKHLADKALAIEWLDSWSCFICRPL